MWMASNQEGEPSENALYEDAAHAILEALNGMLQRALAPSIGVTFPNAMINWWICQMVTTWLWIDLGVSIKEGLSMDTIECLKACEGFDEP